MDEIYLEMSLVNQRKRKQESDACIHMMIIHIKTEDFFKRHQLNQQNDDIRTVAVNMFTIDCPF